MTEEWKSDAFVARCEWCHYPVKPDTLTSRHIAYDVIDYKEDTWIHTYHEACFEVSCDRIFNWKRIV